MKKIITAVLSMTLIMSLSTGSPVLAASSENEDSAAGGYVIEVASEENLAGEYAEAYEAAGYQVTFTYIAEADEDIASVEVYGDFQWFTAEDAAAFEASGYSEKYHALSAYEYTEGTIRTGFGNPGGGDDDYPEGISYSSYVYYTLTETSDHTWQITMPLPAGLYRYQYRITDSEGNAVLTADPENSWGYTIEKNAETPADWSLILIGNSDEVSDSEAYVYPVADETKQGTVEYATIKTYLDTDQSVEIYLPYDYDENDPEPYKTIYVAHGSTECESTWMTIGAIPEIMDNLISEGKLDHCIVVTMDNCVPLNNYGDDAAKNLVECLIPYIEETYNVSTDASDRALCGSSAGGQMTGNVILQYPETFQYYGIFSGHISGDDPAEEDLEVISDISVYLSYGCFEGNVARLSETAELLTSYGVTDIATDILNGAHDWGTWHAAFENFVAFINWGTNTAE